MKNLFKTIMLSALGFYVLTIFSCAPVFSDLQSAKTVGKGKFETTAGFTSTSSAGNGESDHVQNHISVQQAFGIADRVDFRLRAEGIFVDEELGDISAGVFGFGPKFGIVQNEKFFMAGYLPIGFGFGSDIETSETWQMHPTLLFTYQPIEFLEINPSIKYQVWFEENSADYLGFNIGLGIGRLDQWAIRPEYGLLWDLEEGDGHYSQFSLGLTYFY